ncbi:MAG: PAS domain S-box protein [Elusimicrobia bacterium]|nr:PAS domain S-box protein [Elusimicrobiota bacterium]
MNKPHSAARKASSVERGAERTRSDPRFRWAAEAAPNALIMVGADGKISYVNGQAEKLFGYSRKELFGQTIELLVPKRVREHHIKYRQDYFQQPTTRAMGQGRELFGVRKDGAEIPVEIGLNSITTEDGTLVLASVIDITERKRLERKLAQTETLAMVGSMVAAVAHEIRNPLNSIVMAAKLLGAGDLSGEELDQVRTALTNESQRLNRTLEDFLQFARPRIPKKEPGDLNALIHEVLLAAKTDTAVAGRTVTKERLDPRLPRAAFDGDQMRQVLWNLIRNAFQAVEGKGRIEVRTEPHDGGVTIVVEDNGPGVPDDQRERIFAPFFTTKAKGTGLGLPICRSIVTAHGGEIRIDSGPNRGTRFSILLPL